MRESTKYLWGEWLQPMIGLLAVLLAFSTLVAMVTLLADASSGGWNRLPVIQQALAGIGVPLWAAIVAALVIKKGVRHGTP